MNFQPIPRQPDDFQQSLTAEEVKSIFSTAFGTKAKISGAQELGSGLFNNSYLLTTAADEKFILRVAPKEGTAVFANEHRLLQREQSIEPYLRRALGELIPQTIFTDFSQQIIKRDYVIQTFLTGEIWDEVKEEVTSTASDHLWAQLAEIAKAIHQVKGNSFGLPHPEPQFNCMSDALIDICKMMKDNLEQLELAASGITPFLDRLDAGRSFLDQLTTPRLVHGDLWPKNVLIDRSPAQPKIIGLLDAERGAWGDPFSEWIFYYLEIPDSFWGTYGRLDNKPVAQFRQAAFHGQFAIQLLLEAERFSWDAEPFHKQLQQCTQEMETIVAHHLH